MLSLGAGSDTRFWRLPKDQQVKKWVELDFDESTAKKVQIIKRNDKFHQALAGDFTLGRSVFSASLLFLAEPLPEQGGAALRSPRYDLLPADLRSFEWPTLISQTLLDSDRPTLLLLECIFIYIDPTITQSILQWAANTFSQCVVVWYDPIKLDDAFGRVMVNNLRVGPLFCDSYAATKSENTRECTESTD